MLIRQHLDFLQSAIAAQLELLRKMQSQDRPLVDVLMTIPGIKEPAARLILAISGVCEILCPVRF